jgi:hypothetical protein
VPRPGLPEQRHHRAVEVGQFLVVVEESQDYPFDSDRAYLAQFFDHLRRRTDQKKRQQSDKEG